MNRACGHPGFVLPVVLLLVLALVVGVAAVSAHVAALQAARQIELDAAAREDLLETGLVRLLDRALTEFAPVTRLELGQGVVGQLATRGDSRSLYAYTEMRAGPVWEWRGAVVQLAADGLDLPRAAVVARDILWPDGRTDPAVQPAPDEAARAWLLAPLVPPPRVDVLQLGEPWRLDEGARELVSRALGSSRLEGSPRLIVIAGGDSVSVDAVYPNRGEVDADFGIVVVCLEGGLDARNLGSVTGVIIANEGDVLLDGTQLRGAVVTTGTIDFGATGSVLWDPAPWLACTDRLIPRLRLAPGSLEFGFRDEPLLTPIPPG